MRFPGPDTIHKQMLVMSLSIYLLIIAEHLQQHLE